MISSVGRSQRGLGCRRTASLRFQARGKLRSPCNCVGRLPAPRLSTCSLGETTDPPCCLCPFLHVRVGRLKANEPPFIKYTEPSRMKAKSILEVRIAIACHTQSARRLPLVVASPWIALPVYASSLRLTRISRSLRGFVKFASPSRRSLNWRTKMSPKFSTLLCPQSSWTRPSSSSRWSED